MTTTAELHDAIETLATLAVDPDPKPSDAVLGHYLYWGRKWQHILRYRQEGPAAVRRRTLCGLQRAVIVDPDTVDVETHRLVPLFARLFLAGYTNGWPDFKDPEVFDQDNWCLRCHGQYSRQRAKATAARRQILREMAQDGQRSGLHDIERTPRQ